MFIFPFSSEGTAKEEFLSHLGYCRFLSKIFMYFFFFFNILFQESLAQKELSHISLKAVG